MFGIFKIDSNGYAKWAHPDLMSGADANRMADAHFPDCHVLPYREAMRLIDPDTMSEKAVRKSLGMAPRGELPRVVITGKIDGMTRKDAEELCLKMGYHVADTVTRGTKYCICGDGGGRKAQDAQKMGVVCISWKAFTDLT